jgi:hypothetical protein
LRGKWNFKGRLQFSFRAAQSHFHIKQSDSRRNRFQPDTENFDLIRPARLETGFREL